jgi:hypothetical protein
VAGTAGWEELPAGMREAVERETGEVSAAEQAGGERGPAVALVIRTKRNGPLFLKAVREQDAAGASRLELEERVNTSVAGVGPMVRHRFRAAGWYGLAFIRVEGRPIELGPDSPDVAPLAFTLRRMHELRLPEAPVPLLAERFAGHIEPREAAALAGNHLLHTGMEPRHILIARYGGQAYVIDWSAAALGPAWIDPACAAVRLMEAGRPPADALGWLAGFASWQAAGPTAVEAFVNAVCRYGTATAGEQGAAAANARFRTLLGAVSPGRPRPGRLGRSRRGPEGSADSGRLRRG